MNDYRDELEGALSRRGVDESEKVSYMIWGACMVSTRAFQKAQVRVDLRTNRVFVKIYLKWFAKAEKFKRLHDAWLVRARKNCKEHLPSGFRLLIYYNKEI